jgi:hypothetical protein
MNGGRNPPSLKLRWAEPSFAKASVGNAQSLPRFDGEGISNSKIYGEGVSNSKICYTMLRIAELYY